MGLVKIIKSDAMDAGRHVPVGSVQCIFASPPYCGPRPPGTPNSGQNRLWADNDECDFGLEKTIDGYVRHTIEILRRLKPLLRPDGIVLWHLGQRKLVLERIMLAADFDGWGVLDELIWLRYPPCYQKVLRFVKKGTPARRAAAFSGDEVDYVHPEFGTLPVNALKLFIIDTTKPGDLVLDPFARSGTTGVAAGQLGRKCVLLDLNYQHEQRERCAKWL